MMCAFHDSNCNGFGDMWWTDKCTYFSSIDICFHMHEVVCNLGRCAMPVYSATAHPVQV